MKNNGTGLSKRLKRFEFAFSGIKTMFRSEPNSKIHLFAAIIVASIAWFFEVSKNDWLWLIFAITLVFIAELVNTAVEYLVDLVQPDYHEIAGKVKDLMAGAVLVAALFSVFVGVIVFWPFLWK
jgi:diacylglycerol kinase